MTYHGPPEKQSCLKILTCNPTVFTVYGCVPYIAYIAQLQDWSSNNYNEEYLLSELSKEHFIGLRSESSTF
jgi:hypothetical protein